ncbi:MAG TPA: dioxygenase [Albitalea sp.]|uniref:dioxygenase family protein n=1 Tax=Piscinibacter sp. TaxID=1903157 RepID=UPI002ED42DBC
MRNIDETHITDAVIRSFDGCDNPRLKQVLVSLVTHLHDFVREVGLTEAEWAEGIRFLTATGHMCDDQRQEFILLSDTLGISMLTVALNHRKPPGATEATVLGPFHVDDAPRADQGADIAGGARGEAMEVDVSVVSVDGAPVAGAEVDVWQADEDGLYDVQQPALGQRRARALMRTDAQGRLRFRAIVPTAYPIPTDGPVGRLLVAAGRHPWRPAHVHFLIRAEGHETLVTHLFREGDPYLESDAVFGVRSSLVTKIAPTRDGVAHLSYRFVLAPTA